MLLGRVWKGPLHLIAQPIYLYLSQVTEVEHSLKVEKNQNPDCFPLRFIILCWIDWSSPDQGKFQKDTRDLLGKKT